jgi:aryl-alcohol dehydrogenase-like predicted oxidoreductase
VIDHVGSVQPQLSLLRRDALREVIPWCRENGSGVIVYSPLASGILAGSYDLGRLLALPDDDWRRVGADQILEHVGKLRSVAKRHGVEVAGLALAWTLAKDGVTGAIAGARRPEQVAGWIGAADIDLAPETVAEIESIVGDR